LADLNNIFGEFGRVILTCGGSNFLKQKFESNGRIDSNMISTVPGIVNQTISSSFSLRDDIQQILAFFYAQCVPKGMELGANHCIIQKEEVDMEINGGIEAYRHAPSSGIGTVNYHASTKVQFYKRKT
jgi:hypothetical protein